MITPESGFESVFRNSMISALRNLLGEGGTDAIVFHAKLTETNDIRAIHQKLSSFFKMGTPVLERAIVKELFAAMKIPYHERDQFDFMKEFNEASSRFVSSGEGRQAP